MGVSLNNKQRWATEGFRVQRLNSDGTIASPQRFVGFANTADLSKVLENDSARLSIKINAEPVMVKSVDFSSAANRNRVTVEEAVAALNNAGFTDIEFSVDETTGRLKGAVAMGTPASVLMELTSTVDHNLNAGTYSFVYGGVTFQTVVENAMEILAGVPVDLEFTAGKIGAVTLPASGATANLAAMSFNPSLPGVLSDWTGGVVESTQGTNPAFTAKTIQVVSPLAAALDFGQGIRHKGIGLEWRSYFDEETVSIGLSKDIQDRETIDTESAKGKVRRMVIPAKTLGKSPVITMKEKDYYLRELIEGGTLDRETGTYNPPLGGEGGSPSFCVEIFSPMYSNDANTLGDYSGFERIFLRSVTGLEGDVPIEAKAWATYAYNCSAVGYTDENGEQLPAWEEQFLTVEQFDALRVRELGDISENLSASESR